MTPGHDEDIGRAIPEADRLEQQLHADPAVAPDPAVLPDEDWPSPTPRDADDADRLEQLRDVTGDPDEEYAPDLP